MGVRNNIDSNEEELFLHEFGKLKGDLNAKFEDGTVLMLKFEDSKLPGFGSRWVKVVLDKTQGGNTFDMVIKEVSEGDTGGLS